MIRGSESGSVRLGYQTVLDFTLHRSFANTQTAIDRKFIIHRNARIAISENCFGVFLPAGATCWCIEYRQIRQGRGYRSEIGRNRGFWPI